MPSSFPRLPDRQIQKRGLQRQQLPAVGLVRLFDTSIFALIKAQHIHRRSHYLCLLSFLAGSVLLELELGLGSGQLPKLGLISYRCALFLALEVNV